ncbi:MAG: hypothetical protein ACXVZM_13395 [Terriglobales bacterium]
MIAPKTQTRGEVYETYLTHRISERFIFKAAFQRYNYTWSGSGGISPLPSDSIPRRCSDSRLQGRQHGHAGSDDAFLAARLGVPGQKKGWLRPALCASIGTIFWLSNGQRLSREIPLE